MNNAELLTHWLNGLGSEVDKDPTAMMNSIRDMNAEERQALADAEGYDDFAALAKSDPGTYGYH